MEKVNLKKYTLRISSIFILLISVFLCIYAVGNYKSNNTMTQNDQIKRAGNEFNNDINSIQKGKEAHEDITSPSENTTDSNGTIQSKGTGDIASQNKNIKSEQNARITPQNGNRQSGQSGNKQSGQNENMPKGSVDTKYVPALTAYCVIFLILSIVSYYLFRCKKIKINLPDEKIVIFTLLAVGLLLRIAASTLIQGYTSDINYFKTWASSAANNLSQIYSIPKPPDYPPVYLYILAIIGKIIAIPVLNPYYVLLLKLPAIIADIITSYFIYRLGKKYFSGVVSIFLSAFYIFNPAIFIDSTFWGQVDSVFTLFIIFAIFLLCEKKIVFSSMVFALSILMKPQGIIFLPILFFELVGEKKVINFIYAAVSAMITGLIIILPFSLNEQNPLWIFKLYLKTIGEYPYASVNAFNFFSLIGANLKNDTIILFLFNYHTLGMIFIVLITLFSWLVYIKGNNAYLVPAIGILQIAGVFTFSSGMHERYLFPAIALAILAFMMLKDKRYIILAMGFSATNYINISTVLFRINSWNFNIALRFTSLLNVILVIYLIKVLYDNATKKIWLIK